MSLTEQDKIECRDIAYRIIKEVMKEHVVTCPHAVRWRMIAAVFLGAVLGSGLINGIGPVIAKLIMP